MAGEAVVIKSRALPLSRFADVVGSWLDSVVIDQTGLHGEFDIDLEVSPEELPIYRFQRAQHTTPFGGPSLEVALRDQLGLKLERQPGRVEMLLVDAVELPGPN